MNLKFDNITISGGVGVGTTTLMKNLEPSLSPLGWKFTSTGKIFREHTHNDVLPSASLASDDFHRKTEERAYELLSKEKNWVIDAWLAGWVARDLPRVLRVFLLCSEESLVVDRIVNRDKITVMQAKEYIRKRFEDNMETWKRIYGDHDFFDKKYYHLIIDTYSSGQGETTRKVLNALGYPNNH